MSNDSTNFFFFFFQNLFRTHFTSLLRIYWFVLVFLNCAPCSFLVTGDCMDIYVHNQLVLIFKRLCSLSIEKQNKNLVTKKTKKQKNKNNYEFCDILFYCCNWSLVSSFIQTVLIKIYTSLSFVISSLISVTNTLLKNLFVWCIQPRRIIWLFTD